MNSVQTLNPDPVYALEEKDVEPSPTCKPCMNSAVQDFSGQSESFHISQESAEREQANYHFRVHTMV